MARGRGRRKEKAGAQIHRSSLASRDITIETRDRAHGRVVRDARDNKELPIGVADGLADGVMIKQGPVVETHHFLGKGPPQVSSTVPTEPLGDEKAPVAEKREAGGKQRLPSWELGQTEHNLLDKETKVCREDGASLLDWDAVTLLFELARPEPALDVLGVARVRRVASADAVEDGSELSDVAIYRTSCEMTGTPAVEETQFAEMCTGKGVDLSAPTLIAMMEKAKDIQGRGQGKRSGGRERRRAPRALGEECLEVQTKTALLTGVFSIAASFVRSQVLWCMKLH